MRSTRTTLLSRLALAFLLCIELLPATATLAAGSPSPLLGFSSAGILQHDGVLGLADGSMTLADNASPPVALLGQYSRHGTLLAEVPAIAGPAANLHLAYQADLPSGSGLRVDLRGSLDGQRWLPWSVDLPSGALVAFPQPPRRVQLRLTLLGNQDSSPVVQSIAVSPSSAPAQPASYQAAEVPAYAPAPTFRIRATRQGMVGGRTANGFVIPPKARFVSLPCWCVLASKGGNEYQVRISYRGRSTVVPVYDVGPYSERDDYWDSKRDGYPDLERGWPMDHAAYYEGYNGGWADKGYVRYPTAMDVGDGAWIDDLGIVGDQAEVEVTMLWMGSDPLSGPAPRDPALPEQLVDELGADFWHSAQLGPSAVGCGYGRHAYTTQSVASQEQSRAVARWQPALPVAGTYDLYVHVPVCPSKKPSSTAARYVIQHRDGVLEVAVNQAAQTGWVYLGRFPFNADAAGYIQLGDLAGDADRALWYDLAKWVRVS